LRKLFARCYLRIARERCLRFVLAGLPPALHVYRVAVKPRPPRGFSGQRKGWSRWSNATGSILFPWQAIGRRNGLAALKSSPGDLPYLEARENPSSPVRFTMFNRGLR
jgi:hypothetical protein